MKRLKWEPAGRSKHRAEVGAFHAQTQDLGEVHWYAELGPLRAFGTAKTEKLARAKCSKILARVRSVSKVGA